MVSKEINYKSPRSFFEIDTPPNNTQLLKIDPISKLEVPTRCGQLARRAAGNWQGVLRATGKGFHSKALPQSSSHDLRLCPLVELNLDR